MFTPTDSPPGRPAPRPPDHAPARAARDDPGETAVTSTRPNVVFGPPSAPNEVGTLGPYRVVKPLGKGGMGTVYLAVDTRLNRKLALKVMLPRYAANRTGRERFLREARAAAQVAHDNVVTVFEADERNGVPYIAMQYLQGYPLDKYLRRQGNPTIPQVVRLMGEAAAGLAAAHKIGLVHRDVKPANLWLEAPNGRVKVLDFGLAKPVDADVEVTGNGLIVGTPAYMSPEQARGQNVDAQADLFSLGAVLYRLCTGRLPFEGPTVMAVLTALAADDPRPVRDLNPAVPESLADLIHQLLAKDPAGRPPTADEAARRLRAIAADLTRPAAGTGTVMVTAVPEVNPFEDMEVSAEDRTPPPPAKVRAGSAGSRHLVWAVGAAVLVAVGAAGVLLATRNGGAEPKNESLAKVKDATRDRKDRREGPPPPARPEPVKPALTATWADNVLAVRGEHVPGGEINLTYVESFARPGSTHRDWDAETVVPHASELVSTSMNGRVIRLKTRLQDGVAIDHVITVGNDEVDFRLTATNPTKTDSAVEWGSPCVRVDRFTGTTREDAREVFPAYIGKCFVFVDGKLTRLPTKPWATEARYTPGQVYVPKGIDRNNVDPRPQSPLVPSNGLIGAFSRDERWIVASAWEPYQGLVQGVHACVQADFRVGGLKAGETKIVRGKLYVIPADVTALVMRYEVDFPEHSKPAASLRPRRDGAPQGPPGLAVPVRGPDRAVTDSGLVHPTYHIAAKAAAAAFVLEPHSWDW